MPSLLDFLDTPEAALGLGLLAASGPTTDPNQTGIGRVLASGVQYAGARKRAAAELALKESEARRKARIDDLTASLLGDTGGSDGPTLMNPGATGGVGMASTGGAPAAGGSRFGGVPSQAVGWALAGQPKLAEMINERSTPKWLNVGGNVVNTNDPNFRGGVQRQIVTGRDGQVYEVQEGPDGRVLTRVDPSSLQAFQQFQDTSNRSNAQFTPGRPSIDPATGRMVGQSQLQEIGGGPAQTAPVAPPPAAPARPLIGQRPALPEPNIDARGAFTGSPAAILQAISSIPDPQERANAIQAYAAQKGGVNPPAATVAPGTPAALIGGPNALAAVSQAPLPVQSTLGARPAGSAPAVDFSPAEKTAQATQERAAESVAAQTGGMLKEGKDAANTAVQAIGTAQRLMQAIDSNKAFTGKTANVRLGAAQWADALGLGGKDDAEKIANTRVALQELSKLTLSGRKQMSGQGAITESESKLAERAISGDLTLTPTELKILAGAAERAARFQYQQHADALKAAGSNPAIAPQLGMFQPAPLPEPLKPSAPAAPALPSGWSGGKR